MNDEKDFLTQFKGSFYGVLKWPQLDRLWDALRQHNDQSWYIYQVGESPPAEPASAEALTRFITEIDALLRHEHKEDYCGIVYADNMQNPTFIKIFDPNNLGVSCGFSDNPPLPGWVLSLTKPEDLPHAFPPPQSRRRWWQRLFHHG